MKNPIPSEADEQKAIVQWLRLKKITHFAVSNENQHSGIIRQSVKSVATANKIIAMIENKLRAMGKRPGVSDLVVLLPGAKAVFVEMKRRDGGSGESFEQAAWREEITALGFDAYVCKGFIEAVAVIEAAEGCNR
jgi:ribosomal protein L30/L7E